MDSRCPTNARAVAPPKRVRGFTLMELMVTVAIVAILATLAAPSFTEGIHNTRLATQANDRVASLQLARMEAVRRNESVALCRSTDGATCAGTTGSWDQWLTVLPRNGEVLRTGQLKAPAQVTSTVAAVTFRADGLARNAAGALASPVFTVCIPTRRPAANRRVVNLVSGSRVSTASAGNGGGDCP